MKLVIGNKNYSSWSLRPWLLLRQFEIPFEEIQELLGQQNIREILAKYSPSCKVPVLIDKGLTVWDSLAICEYVSERYLDGKGWPDGPALRAEARAISAEMHSGFTALRNEMPMNCRARRKVQMSDAVRRDIDRIETIWSSCIGKHTGDGPWLFGGFSIADCMYAPVVLRFLTYGVRTSAQNRNYLVTVAGNRHILDWITAAKRETEVLAVDETGTDVTNP